MEDPQNTRDIRLLQTDPRELILLYQPTIGIIVRSFIQSGLFDATDYKDIVQQINQELLEKLPRIRAQYIGLSLFRTYLSSIIRNTCLSIHSRNQQKPVIVHMGNLTEDPLGEQADRGVQIEHDILMFRAIMDQFHREKPKVLLCLKLIYDFPVNATDVLQWWPRCPRKDLEAFIRGTRPGGERLKERQRFELLRPLMNRAEGKTTSADSIRWWASDKIQSILRLLNGDPPVAAHTRETVGILFDDFLSPFLLRR